MNMYIFDDKCDYTQKLIGEIVSHVVEPEAHYRNSQELYPDETLKKLGERGFFGLTISDAYGGCGLDVINAMRAIYLLAKSDGAIAHMIETYNFGFCTPIQAIGSDYQKSHFLEKVASGKRKGVLAFTEAEKQIETVAIDVDHGYLLSGSKVMVTDAQDGDYAIVFAKHLSNKREDKGFSAFIVEIKNNNGISIGHPERLCGMQSLKVSDVHFKNVFVPAKNLLGTAGNGLQAIVKSMGIMRLGNSAVAFGIAARAYEEAVQYSKSRILNGAPMIQSETCRMKLAEIKAQLQIMELTIFYSSEIIEKNCAETSKSSSIVKVYVTEQAKDICDSAMQIFGGYGYISGYIVERLYRDVRLLPIIGGTTELLMKTFADTLYS